MKKVLIVLLFVIILFGCKKSDKTFNILGPESGVIGEDVVFEIDIDEDVVWSSSNPSVASIMNTGFVLNKSVGKTTITATLFSDRSISKTFQYEVVEP